MKPQSFLSSIGTAVLWKGLDRLSGLLKHIVIAGAIGLSAQLDVFYMALALLGVLVFSWASLLDVMAVPRMVALWQQGRKSEFDQLTGGLFSLCFLVSLFLTVVIYLAGDFIASIAIGFDADRNALLEEAFFWLIPVLFFYIPLRFIGSVMRALRNFSAYYQAEFIAALVVLVCVVVFSDDPKVLLWSFSLGVALAFFYLLFRARTSIGSLTNPFSPEVRACLVLAPGLLILQGAHFVYVLSDRLFVSFLPEGAVSALAYGMALVALLPGVISISGSFITIIAEKATVAERSSSLNDVISICIYVSTAATLFMAIFGQAMVQVLLERGLFTQADTNNVVSAILGYSWMILPMFLIGVLDQVFQVENKISFMVKRTILGLITNIILNAIFLFGLGWGIWGIALATSISYWIMLLSGLEGVARLGYSVAWRRHALWLSWMTVVMGALYGFSLTGLAAELDGLVRLLVGLSMTLALMLAGGYFYFGRERELVRGSLNRVMAGLRGAR